MKIVQTVVLIFLLPMAGFAQIDRFEFYGGVNLTRPIFRGSFASSELRPGYTFGALYSVRELRTSGLTFHVGVGFTQRVYNVLLDFSDPSENPKGIFAKNYLQDIEFPLLVSHTWDFNNFQLKIHTGLIPGLNVLYKSELKFTNMPNHLGIQDNYEETRSIRPNAFRRMNVFAGLSIVKKMKIFKLGLQPNFQFNFLPEVQENSSGPKFLAYGFNMTFSK